MVFCLWVLILPLWNETPRNLPKLPISSDLSSLAIEHPIHKLSGRSTIIIGCPNSINSVRFESEKPSECLDQNSLASVHLWADWSVWRVWKSVLSKACWILLWFVMLTVSQLFLSTEKSWSSDFGMKVHAWNSFDEAAGEVFLRWYYWNISLRSWELALTSWISLSLIPWSYRIVKVAMNGFSIELTNPVAPDRFWSAKIKAFYTLYTAQNIRPKDLWIKSGNGFWRLEYRWNQLCLEKRL